MRTPSRANVRVVNDRGLPPEVIVNVPNRVAGATSQRVALVIYPNPGSADFRLQFASSRNDLRLRVSTATGQLVLAAVGGVAALNELAVAAMAPLPAGAYHFQIEESRRLYAVTWIKR